MFYFKFSGDRDMVRNLVVLLTDGRANNFEDAWEEAQLTRRAGIDIVTLGINARDFPL